MKSKKETNIPKKELIVGRVYLCGGTFIKVVKKTKKQYKFVEVIPDSIDSIDAVMNGSSKHAEPMYQGHKVSGSVLQNRKGDWYIKYNAGRWPITEVEPYFIAMDKWNSLTKEEQDNIVQNHGKDFLTGINQNISNLYLVKRFI